MNIEYINHSLGNNYGDEIELNENLKKYPKLHDSILNHELKHTKKVFSFFDLKHDIVESKVNSKDLLFFMFKHPKSFYQLLPFYWTRKRGFVYDINLILIYISMLILSIGSVYIFNKIV